MAKRDPLIRRARRNPAVLRRALRNPEKRARLPENMIPRKFRPIVPGSAVTNKQLNRESKAAARIKYGPVTQAQRQQVGEAKAYQRDIGNYYDDYVKQVQAQSANVQQIGREAQAAVQGTQAGVTGLAAVRPDPDEPGRHEGRSGPRRDAGDLAQMASGAAATRQALVGSFSAQQAATNAANSTYAGNRANVVAPGPEARRGRAGARARAPGEGEPGGDAPRRRARSGSPTARSARPTRPRTCWRRRRSGSTCSRPRPGSPPTSARTSWTPRRPGRTGRPTSGQHRRRARARSTATAQRRGGEAAQRAAPRSIKDDKAKPADSVYTSGAFAGSTKSELDAMSQGGRERLVDQYKADRARGRRRRRRSDYRRPRRARVREGIARCVKSATA